MDIMKLIEFGITGCFTLGLFTSYLIFGGAVIIIVQFIGVKIFKINIYKKVRKIAKKIEAKMDSLNY